MRGCKAEACCRGSDKEKQYRHRGHGLWVGESESGSGRSVREFATGCLSVCVLRVVGEDLHSHNRIEFTDRNIL